MSEGNGKAQPKKYSKKLRTLEVLIEEEDGSEQTYTLKELRGPERDAFLKHRSQFLDKDDKPIPEKMSGLMASLLAGTLYGPDGSLVTVESVTNLPSDTQIGLFQDSVALSGLDKGAERAAKNA